MDGTATKFEAPQTFRSPTHILVPKLAHSRDRWKAKAAERRHQLKLAKLNIRDLQRSRESWREQCGELEERLRRQAEQIEQLQRERDAALAAAAVDAKKK
jgi:hypothetical protein